MPDQPTDAIELEDRRRILAAIRERRVRKPSPTAEPMSREEKLRRTHEMVTQQEIEWGETMASLRRDARFARLMSSDDWSKLESLRLEAKSGLHLAMRPFRDRLFEELDSDEQRQAGEIRSEFQREIETVEAEMASQLHACIPEGDREVITEDDIREILAEEELNEAPDRFVAFDLGDATSPPIVLGEQQTRPLTDAQRDVLQTLIEAGQSGLTKDMLDKRSGRSEGRKILARLAESNEAWKKALVFPGKARNGYRLHPDCLPPTNAH